MTSDDVIGHLIIGGAVTIAEFIILVRKHASIGLGGGRDSGGPVVVVELKGTSMIILAISTIASGGLIGFPSLLALVGHTILEDWILWMPHLGLATLVIGFIFSLIIQVAISAGESIKAYNGTHPLEEVPKSDEERPL